MEKRWKEVPQDDAGIRSREEGKKEEALTRRHKKNSLTQRHKKNSLTQRHKDHGKKMERSSAR